MLANLLVTSMDKVFGINGYFYQALSKEIPIQDASIVQTSSESIEIVPRNSSSLSLVPEEIGSDVIIPVPRPARIKAYTKKIDSGTIRVSSHVRKPAKPTLKQGLSWVQKAINRDTTMVKPKFNPLAIVKEAIVSSMYRLST